MREGSSSVRQALAMPHQRGPELISFEAEVRDVSRQAIAARASVIVHPAQFYLALAPPKDTFLEHGKPRSTPGVLAR